MNHRTDTHKLQEQVDEAVETGMTLVHQSDREAVLVGHDGLTGELRIHRWFLQWGGVDCQAIELGEDGWQKLVEHVTEAGF